jgi:enoyl-CoA hydratase/carnithine racemase
LFALLESSILKIYGCTFTQVALVNGLAMGGGAALVAPLKFAVVTEKTVRDTIPTFLCFYATLMVYFFLYKLGYRFYKCLSTSITFLIV